mgnify:CR=1 FL=1
MSKKTELDGYDAKTRRMMKGMAAAENRALAARAEEECECKEGMFSEHRSAGLPCRGRGGRGGRAGDPRSQSGGTTGRHGLSRAKGPDQ